MESNSDHLCSILIIYCWSQLNKSTGSIKCHQAHKPPDCRLNEKESATIDFIDLLPGKSNFSLWLIAFLQWSKVMAYCHGFSSKQKMSPANSRGHWWKSASPETVIWLVFFKVNSTVFQQFCYFFKMYFITDLSLARRECPSSLMLLWKGSWHTGCIYPVCQLPFHTLLVSFPSSLLLVNPGNERSNAGLLLTHVCHRDIAGYRLVKVGP